MNTNKLSLNLKENENYIKSILGESSDVIFRLFVIPGFNNCKAFIIYIDGLIGNKEVDDVILAPLIAYSQLSRDSAYVSKVGRISALMEAGVLSPSVKKAKTWNEVLDATLSGDTALFIDNCDTALILASRGWESRAVSEPVTEGEVRGPKDSFIENIRSNTALIRRRIKDYSLRFESMKIGDRTKTDIALVYIDNLVNKGVLGELKSRLERIKVDSILESGYIEEFIEDSPLSIFPQIEHTERPDKASAAILEGRIVILVDNTPFALIVPTVFWQFMQATGDYYERYFIGIFSRLIRLLALFLSVTLSSIYIMLASFHQEMIPTPLALRIAAGREGVPFPSILEVLLMEVMFEIMREAGIRMPKPVGQAVSIVGALVIGDAAVSAGLVGPILVIVVAVAGISSFALPAYNLSTALRFVKFGLIIITGILGLLGFLGGCIIVVLYLLSLRSFGTPFFAPIIPFRKSGNKDTIIRVPWWAMKTRPNMTKPQDVNRQSQEDLRPKPPPSK